MGSPIDTLMATKKKEKMFQKRAGIIHGQEASMMDKPKVVAGAQQLQAQGLNLMSQKRANLLSYILISTFCHFCILEHGQSQSLSIPA